MGEPQRSAAPPSAVAPANNAELQQVMLVMLIGCALGDILAFTIILVALMRQAFLPKKSTVNIANSSKKKM